MKTIMDLTRQFRLWRTGKDDYGYEHSRGWQCPECRQPTIWTKEINTDYGDLRCKCATCGASWIAEGSDA